MSTIIVALLSFAVFSCASLASSLQLPAQTVATSIIEIKNLLDKTQVANIDGIKYASKFVIDLSKEVDSRTLWRISIDKEKVTMTLSATAFSQDMPFDTWIYIFSKIYSAIYWTPIHQMSAQQVLNNPSTTTPERVAIRLNDLQALYELQFSRKDDAWDVARELVKPSAYPDSTSLVAALYRSLAQTFDVDLVVKEGDTAEDVNKKTQELALKIKELLGAIIEKEKPTVQKFLDLQKNRSKFFQTSARVSDLVALVKNNDRNNVAKMLEHSLPWDLFTSQETAIYRRFVDSIRNPDWSQAVYLIRGTKAELDPAPETEGMISKLFLYRKFQNMTINEAYSEYRNQWSFRAENHKQFITFPNFFNLGENHSHSSGSKDGIPSALISTTASGPVSTKFAKRGMKVMVRVDPRRAYPNYESMMYFEREALVPFFVFPDEVEGLVIKDEGKRTSSVIRTKDNTINVPATEFYQKHMARDKDAEIYIQDIWERGYRAFFSDAFPKPRINLCVGFYSH